MANFCYFSFVHREVFFLQEIFLDRKAKMEENVIHGQNKILGMSGMRWTARIWKKFHHFKPFFKSASETKTVVTNPQIGPLMTFLCTFYLVG